MKAILKNLLAGIIFTSIITITAKEEKLSDLVKEKEQEKIENFADFSEEIIENSFEQLAQDIEDAGLDIGLKILCKNQKINKSEFRKKNAGIAATVCGFFTATTSYSSYLCWKGTYESFSEGNYLSAAFSTIGNVVFSLIPIVFGWRTLHYSLETVTNLTTEDRPSDIEDGESEPNPQG